jgi:hypothetical protein
MNTFEESDYLSALWQTLFVFIGEKRCIKDATSTQKMQRHQKK